MKNYLTILLVAIVASFGVTGCSDDESTKSETSTIQLKLIDAPGDYMEVNVEIVDIQYQSDEGGWKSFQPTDGYPINVDLTELVAGNDLLLVDDLIPSGMLNQIRLVLSDNNTLLIEGENEGETISTKLDTPSAQQSGLKIKLEEELKPGFSYTFILDWDVNKSIVKAGNSGKYNLKPVIRANAVVNSGSISGKVIGKVLDDEIDEAVPLKGAVVTVYDSENNELVSTFTNVEGDFLIQGLDAGEYKVKIEHPDFISYEPSEFIKVVVGEIFLLGTIELAVPVS